MNAQNGLDWKRMLTLGALGLTASCGGGGGGGSSGGSLGAFSGGGMVVSLDPGDLQARVEAVGAGGYQLVGALARDSARDVLYGIDFDRGVLLRIDANGTVGQVGPVDLSSVPGCMVHDPRSGLLLGVRDGGRVRDSLLVRIDPRTAAMETVATTSGVRALALDSTRQRLLGSTASGLLLALDPETGSSTVLFDHATLGSVNGLSFDPLTGALHGVATGSFQDGQLLTFDLASQSLESAWSFDRGLVDLAFDDDSGRFFGLTTGGAVVELIPESGSRGRIEVLATLGRELAGLSFDPADGRYFAVDARNHELVKLDPRSGRSTVIARLSRLSTRERDVHTLAYDPLLDRLYAVDRSNGAVLRVDPRSGECSEIGLTLGVAAILVIDPDGGRLIAYDQAVEVLVELDPDAPSLHILRNAVGLHDVSALGWDPLTQLLVAVHLTDGRPGDPLVSKFSPIGPGGSVPELRAPRGLTGFGRDARTGLYHGFGPGQPLYEFDLDLAPRPTRLSTVRSLDGAWRVAFRAALSVASRGVVYAIDSELLYEYDPRQRSMRLLGELPVGLDVTDLVWDPTRDVLGLRDGDEVHWVDPAVPFNSQQSDRISGTPSLRIACDPVTGRTFGVSGGFLFRLTLGTPGAEALTQVPLPQFDVDSIAYDPRQDAVLAVGRLGSESHQSLVRFDASTGEWTEAGRLSDTLQVLFVN